MVRLRRRRAPPASRSPACSCADGISLDTAICVAISLPVGWRVGKKSAIDIIAHYCIVKFKLALCSPDRRPFRPSQLVPTSPPAPLVALDDLRTQLVRSPASAYAQHLLRRTAHRPTFAAHPVDAADRLFAKSDPAFDVGRTRLAQALSSSPKFPCSSQRVTSLRALAHTDI